MAGGSLKNKLIPNSGRVWTGFPFKDGLRQLVGVLAFSRSCEAANVTFPLDCFNLDADCESDIVGVIAPGK